MSMPARRSSHVVHVGSIPVGGTSPVVVQSMTNTDTEDAESTALQVADLARSGSEIVRITVNTRKAAEKVPEIQTRLHDIGVDVPLVGDFHFNGHQLLREYPETAEILAKYRINPGNVGRGSRHDENFATMIKVAIDHDRPVRIGVNGGSLDQALLDELMDQNAALSEPRSADAVFRDAMVESALRSANLAEEVGLASDKIIISCKMSRVPEMIAVYRAMAARCAYPLHLGLTEAGMGSKGIVASTAALSALLLDGIGDTIRVSLTPEPGGDRREEVRICQHVLQSLEIRPFAPSVTACPGCGRTTSTFFQELARDVERHLMDRLPTWREQYPGVETMTLAVMGCVVNGPGESKAADIGISLPGTGEDPKAPVYVDGQLVKTLRGPTLASDFTAMVEAYVVDRFGSGADADRTPTSIEV